MASPTVKPLIDDTQEEKDSFNLWEAMKSVSTEATIQQRSEKLSFTFVKPVCSSPP